MSDVLRSLLFALGHILHPRMLWLMVWPVLIALAIWGTVAIVFWTQLALWLAGHLKQWLESATFFVTWDAGDAAYFAARLLILLMLVPLIQLTSLLILGAFGMPPMVEHVAVRRFPQLGRRRGGSTAGSVWNSALALLGLAGL
ncbi:MAG: EI24 domain-containing protein, partial [Burkholderiales bacterium]